MRVKFFRESCFISKRSVTGLHHPQSPNLQSSKKHTFVTQLVASLTFLRGAACDHSLSHVCLGPGSSNPHTCRVCPNLCHGSEEYLDFPSKTYKFLNLETLGPQQFQRCIVDLYYFMPVVHESRKLWDRFMMRSCRFFSSWLIFKSSKESDFSPFLPPSSSLVNQVQAAAKKMEICLFPSYRAFSFRWVGRTHKAGGGACFLGSFSCHLLCDHWLAKLGGPRDPLGLFQPGILDSGICRS